MIKVAITGMGIVSAIGNTPQACFNALVELQSGIGPLTQFYSYHAPEIQVAEVPFSNAYWIEKLGLPSENNYTRTSLLGAYAAQQAVKNAQLTQINAHRTGLISSTSVAGMDFTERYFNEYASQPELHKYITSHDPGDSSNKIADFLGLEGFVSTLSTACSSAANAIMMGAKLIETGRLDRVIVGGADALSKFTINGFKTLMILSDAPNTPFDAHRKGLNLGEAAAYLVLESEAMVQHYQKKVLAYVSGYGNANDAFHQTASSDNGEGAYQAMSKALQKAQLTPEAIDYINVHGTATPNNDLSEGRAMLRLFDAVPDFSSTKGYTGHTLAAAAAIESVFSVLALQHQTLYPNLNFVTPMPEFDLVPVQKVEQKKLNYVLSNSFGFGGNCSTLIFSKGL